MIKQFAIEPECLASWEQFRFFMDQVGVPHGRLVASLPEHWISVLLTAVLDQNLKKKIETRLATESFKAKFFRPPGAAYDGSQSWLANAMAAHSRRRFHAIIVDATPTNHPDVICAADIDETDARWRADRSVEIPRTSASMARIAEPLLRLSREVVLVDRFLFRVPRDSSEPLFVSDAHLRTLQRLFRTVQDREFSLVEYHCGDHFGRGPNWAVADDRIRACLSRCQPMSVVLWPHQTLHDRYILTEIGGLSFGHGLDEGRGQVHVNLLDGAVHKSLWSRYRGRYDEPTSVHNLPTRRDMDRPKFLGWPRR